MVCAFLYVRILQFFLTKTVVVDCPSHNNVRFRHQTMLKVSVSRQSLGLTSLF